MSADLEDLNGRRMINRKIKNYTVTSLLGKGGMGAVYLAKDTTLDRNVAIKVLPPELMRDDDRRRRFVQEAKAASAVNHPAIAQIYEIGEEEGTSYIVMEYVDGKTIRQLVQDNELDVTSALEVAILIGDALARAHEAKIVHRDIKSDNIMVTHDGHPKILDFGLAKLLDHSPAADGSQVDTVTMTQIGTVIGTVAYMSPEQARGLAVDHRSDIFSFGIVLFEMATGRLPFKGESALDTMHAIAFDQTQPLSTMRDGLPYSLQRVVDQCLAKQPEKRFQSMSAVVEDLKRVKREFESGVTTSVPVLEQLKVLRRSLSLPKGFTTRGLVVMVIWGLIGLIPLLSGAGGVGGLISLVVVWFMAFGHVRGRRNKLVRKFSKKSSKIKEVRLVSYQEGQFIVVLVKPKAKTYVKLNALLEQTNAKLYDDPQIVMVAKEDLPEDEVKMLVTHTGIQYLRDS